jgi:ABC-type transport system involved in multi-copper enzyme maturation permease subunit
MARVLAIVWQDLRVFLSDRSNLPSLLVTPAVMTVVIALVTGGAFGSGSAVRRLDVLDYDASPASRAFLDSVREANPSLTLCPMDNDSQDVCQLGPESALDESIALDRAANSTSLALLEIPKGFGAAIRTRRSTSVTFRSAEAFGASQAAQQAVDSAVSQVNSAAAAASVGLNVVDKIAENSRAMIQDPSMGQAIYQKALDMWDTNPIGVEFRLSGEPEDADLSESLQQGLGQSVPGMGTMFVLMTVFGGMAALIVEKEQGTLQRLGVMPISRSMLLAGKVLARFSLGVIQFLVVFVVGALLGMDFGKDALALLLLAAAYTLSVTALSFAIGSRLKNAAQANGMALLLTLTLAPLGGAWWPLEISPRFMQILGHASPVAWAMEAFTKLTYQGGTLGDIWVQLLVLVGFAVVAFAVGIPRFSYDLD